MTGWRCCDQDGVIRDDGQRAPVFNDSGIQIGDWPPIVAYPADPVHLGKAAQAWVRLTFQNESGDTAEAFRRLTTPPAGQPLFESKIDQSLLSTPQLIETGLLMPARLARIGFGEHSHSIYEAIKLLTGLDQLSDIGEGAANFAHKAKRFLKYAADSGIQAAETKMNLQLKRAEEEAAKASFVLTIKHKREEKEYAQELRDIARDVSVRAGNHLSTLVSDVHPQLDIANPADRTKIKNAVATARGLLQQGVKDIPVFQAWSALKAAQADEKFQSLPQTLEDCTARLEEAIGWDRRQAEDVKLRLKAVASTFYAPSDHERSEPDCPLCEGKLSGEKQRALAAELAELKAAAAAAERKLSDACAEIEKRLRDLLPQGVQAQFELLATMQPCDGFKEAALDRFAKEPPFSNVLVGIARFTEATVEAQADKLPRFAPPPSVHRHDLPELAKALYIYMHRIECIVALAAWWEPNRGQFVDAWTALKGTVSADGSFPPDTQEGKLATLEAALEKAAPLDEIARALKEVADAAGKWLPIHTHQLLREQIAKHLEPLKDLRVLVATQTSSTISTLSSRIKTILNRIHFNERLIFEDAALSKKTVQVRGSFSPGIRIDASTVANSSWLRAILWAFVLALREHTLEGLRSNPFPLMVLDDPQATFDPRNKRKWAEEIARHANADASSPGAMQLIVITHERQFFQMLVNLEKLAGQQGLVSRLSANSPVATVVNGASLARTYAQAHAENDDTLGHRYVLEIRTYCEDLLKIMLRCEGAGVADMTLGDLGKVIKKLRDSTVSPFNRPPFQDLLNTIAGGGGAKPMKIINEAHHKFDGTVGVAQATDVRSFWEKTLQTQLHTCFKIHAEFEAYAGEPRLFPWMDNVVALPCGGTNDIKRLSLVETGIAAAAKSDGRAGDGLITLEDLATAQTITLPNHSAYQLAAGTLEPVATIGDVILVSNYAKVHPRNLVVTAFGERLLARRWNETDIHPHIATLTGQAVDPYALVQPVIVPKDRVERRKIVGTLFTSSLLAPPVANANAEFVSLPDLAPLKGLLDGARLFKVSGRSAEPLALDGQFLITRTADVTPAALSRMDGRLVIAFDEAGTRYFKRFRQRGPIVILESLNPDGLNPAEVLSLSGELNMPRLTGLLEVVGVLFELPG